MGLRFRRRVKMFPGCYINVSGSGISTSLGVRGASMTFSKKGTHLNLGIPGTGISLREKISNSHQKNLVGHDSANSNIEYYNLEEIKSLPPHELTSVNLEDLSKLLKSARDQRVKSKKERTIFLWCGVIALLTIVLWPIGVIILCFAFFRHQKFKRSFVDLTSEISEEYKIEFDKITNAFDEISRSKRVWDITGTRDLDAKSRSAAKTELSREKVKIKLKNPDYIQWDRQIIALDNANGADIFIAPGFLIFDGTKKDEFALIDLKEIDVRVSHSEFLEEDEFFNESTQIGETWKYVNKNGGPDKRFASNPIIPILLYPTITFFSKNGLHESYMFSNTKAGSELHQSIKEFENFIGGK